MKGTLLYSQTTLINPATDGGFETGTTFSANNWTVVNGSNNKWYVGTFAKCTGARAAYIDVNSTSGAANNYNKNNYFTSHFYRNVTFPAGETSITLNFNFKGTGESIYDYVQVFLVGTGTTPVAGTELTTGQIGEDYYNLTGSCTSYSIHLPASAAGTTKRLVFSWSNDDIGGSDPAASIDDISLISKIPVLPANDNPCTATSITPGTSCVFNTYTNVDASASPGVPAPGCANYVSSDVWFSVVVPASGNLIFDSNTGTMTDGAMAVYSGTCSSLTLLACDDDNSTNGSMPYINLSGLSSGSTVWVRFWGFDADNEGTFRLCVSSPVPPVNDNPCSAITINPTSICNYINYSNATASATAGVADPVCSNYQGGDVWFKTTIPSSGTLTIDTKEGSVSDGGIAIYTGTCGALTEVDCDDDNSTNGAMPMLYVTGLAAGTQIWIRFWERGNDNNGSFGLCVYNQCLNGPPSNDACTNAIGLTLSVPSTGTNACASNTGEPSAPSCWTTGSVNSVWYSVQAPASGKLRVRVIPISLTDPQVAIYSGTCGSSMIAVGCNDNSTPCGTTTNASSDLSVAGLAAGSTYYISVDGALSSVGEFGILVIDGAGALPALSNGQDCGTYLQTCDTTMSFGNPGFQSFGNICDFPGGGSNCLSSGERASVWFEVLISANGLLEFTIVPKDWSGIPYTDGTDYDYAVWKTGGTGAVTCAQISSGSAPKSCNYDPYGVTGAFGAADGIAPSAYPGFGTAFSKGITVSSGDKYVLVVSNFNNSSSGFDVIFSNASPITYTGTGTYSTWSGGEDTDWFNKRNWGGCPIPSCSRDAIINGGLTLQPSVNGVGATAKNVVINTGATLTLASGQKLSVCQDFTNNGTLNASPTSYVDFSNGSVIQNIGGNVTGSNALGGIVIDKTGGAVNLIQNLDMSGDFLINSAASSFNANGKYHKIAGNFTNNGTYTPGTGTLEFNGSAAQTYSNASSLNNVLMNNSSSGLTISTNMVIGNSGTLTLTNGKIITAGITEVQVLNRTSSSVSTGNTTSYVEGSLRRYLNGTGSYDFPLGESGKGYQRCNINFAYPAAPTIIDNLLGKFSSHSSTPAALGSVDCANTYSSPGLNNGKWTFTPSSNPTSGNFDLSLYNLNFSNNAGGVYTVMSDLGSGWVMGNGTCATSTVSLARRTGMNSLNGSFATAQSPGSLPVELILFKAKALQKSVMLNWTTASESNNKGFVVERAGNAAQFSSIGWMNGAGSSHYEQNYSFEDKDVSYGELYYYRLTQVDFDGKESTSPVVTVLFLSQDKNNSVNLYPNPVTSDSKIILMMNDADMVEINIISMDGREKLLIENKYRLKGSHEININPYDFHLMPGMYMISVKIGMKKAYLKMIFYGKE